MPRSNSDSPASSSTAIVKKDVEWIIKEMDRMNKEIEELDGCNREKEFDAMQVALVDGHKFFRNTIAVGVIAAIIAVGGWLWSLFGIVTHNDKLDADVATIAAGLKENTTKDEEFKEKVHDAQIENIEKVNGQISQSEFRIMSAVAQISRGKVEAPSPEMYREYRERHIRKSFKRRKKPVGTAQVKKMVAEELDALGEGPAPLAGSAL